MSSTPSLFDGSSVENSPAPTIDDFEPILTAGFANNLYQNVWNEFYAWEHNNCAQNISLLLGGDFDICRSGSLRVDSQKYS